MRKTAAIVLVLVAACSSPAIQQSTSQTTTSQTGRSTTTIPSVDTTATQPPPPDLSAVPLYWFAPLPDMPTNHGSIDFMDLFSPDAAWTEVTDRLDVFKLYGEWVAYHATDDELHTAVQWIHDHHLALAVEAGPLDAPADCGGGVEGFAGTEEGRLIGQRIARAEGRIDAIALDEPYYFASHYDGPNACHWDAEMVAVEIGKYIEVMKSFFPDIVVGDTEPLVEPVQAETYEEWLETFRLVNGYDLAFIHLDVDWGRPVEWTDMTQHVVSFGRDFGVPVGVIFNGTADDSSDEMWLGITGERLKRYLAYGQGPPDHVLFQSWNDHPDQVLPVDDPYTFTGMIDVYFNDPDSLGFRREGAGANLGLDGQASASTWIAGSEPELAFDGDSGTFWSAGDFAIQWVQVDLDAPADVAKIVLVPSQSPSGHTTHVVEGSGPGTDGDFRQLGVLTGLTSDDDQLTLIPDQPWPGLDKIRVTTTDSPSWVAWREIQVIAD